MKFFFFFAQSSPVYIDAGDVFGTLIYAWIAVHPFIVHCLSKHKIALHVNIPLFMFLWTAFTAHCQPLLTTRIKKFKNKGQNTPDQVAITKMILPVSSPKPLQYPLDPTLVTLKMKAARFPETS